jgi:large subunit ribosomal protein L7/L12
VQYRQPELFKAAALNPRILLDLSRKDSAASSGSEDMLKGDAPLSEVIKTIDFKSVEVIASYIFLTEVVSVRQVLFDVVIDAVGSDKIAAIKAIREFTGLDLVEAKTLIESTPPFVARGSMERDQAEKMLSMLLAAGMSASLR